RADRKPAGAVDADALDLHALGAAERLAGQVHDGRGRAGVATGEADGDVHRRGRGRVLLDDGDPDLAVVAAYRVGGQVRRGRGAGGGDLHRQEPAGAHVV